MTADDPATPASGWRVDVPLVGPVGWPPTGNLVYLATIGGLVAFDVLAWPVAGALALGHVLARYHDFPAVRALGEGLQEA